MNEKKNVESVYEEILKQVGQTNRLVSNYICNLFILRMYICKSCFARLLVSLCFIYVAAEQRIVISMKVNTYLAPTYIALVFLSYVSPYLNHILY